MERQWTTEQLDAVQRMLAEQIKRGDVFAGIYWDRMTNAKSELERDQIVGELYAMIHPVLESVSQFWEMLRKIKGDEILYEVVAGTVTTQEEGRDATG